MKLNLIGVVIEVRNSATQKRLLQAIAVDNNLF